MIITKDKFIKFLDYSSFKWDTFTLPFEGYQFFNIDELSQDKIDITLIDENNNTYSSYIRYTDKSRENSPTRLLKWNKDFTSYLKEHIPQWETIKKGEKSENFQLIFKPSDEPNVFYITISSKFSLVEDVNKRYFIFTTGKKENDVDFETYPWERSRFDKVREGDFFVYKKSSSLSENKKLYFFGMGQVGPIEGDDYVVTQIINPVKFDNIIHQEDLNDLQIGSPAESLELIKKTLNNEGFKSGEDISSLNSAAVIYVSDLASSFEKAFEKAIEVIKSGTALNKLKELATFSNKFNESA